MCYAHFFQSNLPSPLRNIICFLRLKQIAKSSPAPIPLVITRAETHGNALNVLYRFRKRRYYYCGGNSLPYAAMVSNYHPVISVTFHVATSASWSLVRKDIALNFHLPFASKLFTLSNAVPNNAPSASYKLISI